MILFCQKTVKKKYVFFSIEHFSWNLRSRYDKECLQNCGFYTDESNTILSNIEWTWASFFKHWRNLNVFVYGWSNSNTQFLASLTRFSKILIEPTWTLLFQTSNRLERFNLLVIEPIFGFEWSNIKFGTYLEPSLEFLTQSHTCMFCLSIFFLFPQN